MYGYRSIKEVILSFIAIIVSLTIHEYSHGLISSAQGDDTPKLYGRLTLNPLAHIDIMGLVSLFLFRFGWAKPVPISSRNYKNPRMGIVLTSAAGPISNLILAFFSLLSVYLFKVQSEELIYFFRNLIFINIGLAVFNLIPVPPLDGSKILAETLGGAFSELIYKIERFGMIILILLLWFTPLNEFLSKIIYNIALGMENFILIFFNR